MKQKLLKKIVMAAAIGAIGISSAMAAVTARLGHAMPESHPQAQAMNKFVELAGKYTGNNVQVKAFHGNFAILVRALTYLKTLGGEGLRDVAEHAVLNANYLMKALSGTFPVPYDRSCMHEFVLSPKNCKDKGVKALDMAKRLLDYGHHAPTVYFPLTVKECLMIEPTESESKDTLDAFCDAMIELAEIAEQDPDALHRAPEKQPVGRLDEVLAAKRMDLAYTGDKK